MALTAEQLKYSRQEFLAWAFHGMDPLDEAVALSRPVKGEDGAGRANTTWPANKWMPEEDAAALYDALKTRLGYKPAYGNPYKCPSNVWLGATHFAISTVATSQPQGRFSRSRKFAKRTFVIVCDDIGKKAPMMTSIEPHWIMETSPGSWQVGYAIEPTADEVTMGIIFNSLAEAGLTDKAVTDITRLVRLDGSKPLGKQHAAKLIWWDPTLPRYKATAFLALAGVETVEPPRQVYLNDKRRFRTDVPDSLLDLLIEQDMILDRHENDGWVAIRCPWAHQHTNGDESGTKYLPMNVDGRRAFHCWHEHCQHRKVAALEQWSVRNGVIPTRPMVRKGA